jgi:PAS domain S-box-containing protein
MKQFLHTIELLENSNFYYVITTNLNGTYRYVNNHYRKSFAYISNDIVGLPYQVTMHADDTIVCEETAGRCISNPGQMFPATIRKHDGKGGYIITQWEYKAMFTENGEPDGIFCLGYDITKHIEDHQQLKAAESEIEKRKDTLREIAFQHSHLIRGPLSNILGLAALLEEMDVDSNVKNICSMIVESSNRLDNIVRAVVGKSYQ